MNNSGNDAGAVGLVERINAIRADVFFDAFNPDARMAARSLFEAQEKFWALAPEIIARLTNPAEPSEEQIDAGVKAARLLRNVPTRAYVRAIYLAMTKGGGNVA